MDDKIVYHVHRLGCKDHIWYAGNELNITNEFSPIFYSRLDKFEKALEQKYGNYDLDKLIEQVEKIKSKEDISTDLYKKYITFLNNCYALRMEKALEFAREIYNDEAPSRIHSLYVSSYDSVSKYWSSIVGKHDYEIYKLSASGNFFTTSDKLYPDLKLDLDSQIVEAKKYWKPSKKDLEESTETLFNGKVKILTKL